MTTIDALGLLRQKCTELNQARVARELGVSSGTVSQILSGTYGADPGNVLQRAIEVYGGLTVECPVLGDLPLYECSIERKATDRANHRRVLLFRTCPTCRHNPRKEEP